MNKKIVTLVIIIITIALGGVAVYTGWRISKLSTTTPEKSRAANTTDSCEVTSFTISRIEESPSPSPSPSPTQSPSPSPTDSPNPTATPTSTPTPTDSPTSTPAPSTPSTPNPTSTPSQTPRVSIPSTASAVPVSGASTPTIVLSLFGIVLLIIGIQISTMLVKK